MLEVIYLIFNEGYSATAGDDWMRPELCAEALRLGRMLAQLAPDEPEVHGLVALMEIQSSRLRARTGPSGEPILLLDQDRSPWDRLLINRGLAALGPRRAARRRARPVRAAGRDRRVPRPRRAAEDTDWPRIAALYAVLAGCTVADRRAQPGGRGRRWPSARQAGSISSTQLVGNRRCATITCCPACAATC